MASANHVERARREGVLLGIPLGDLGWFQSLLMGTATGFAAFFLTTFCTIVVMLIYAATTHHPVNYADSYRLAGFPVGVVVLILALGYLGVQWIRRITRQGHSA